jgi:hypothetical protein
MVGMNRRELLKAALALPFAGVMSGGLGSALAAVSGPLPATWKSRVRPGDPGWPSATQWDRL